jgi:hypothetical protein
MLNVSSLDSGHTRELPGERITRGVIDRVLYEVGGCSPGRRMRLDRTGQRPPQLAGVFPRRHPEPVGSLIGRRGGVLAEVGQQKSKELGERRDVHAASPGTVYSRSSRFTWPAPGNREIGRHDGEETAMTSPMSQAALPAAAAAAANAVDADEDQNSRATVGASDADADAARAGADVDLDDATRDSDGVPVGQADAEADVRRAEADADQV